MIPLGLVGLLVVAGFFVQDDDTTPTTTTVAADGTPDDVDLDEAVEVAAALVASHGGRGGFDALVYALERGYSYEQIRDAARAGTLDAVGVVDGSAPGGDPLGLVDLSLAGDAMGTATAMRVAARAATTGADNLYTLAVVLLGRADVPYLSSRNETSEEQLVIELITALLVSGYTPQQVVEGIILGAGIDVIEHCVMLRDSDGTIIAPPRTYCAVYAAIELGRSVDGRPLDEGEVFVGQFDTSPLAAALSPLPFAIIDNDARVNVSVDDSISGRLVLTADVPAAFTCSEGCDAPNDYEVTCTAYSIVLDIDLGAGSFAVREDGFGGTAPARISQELGRPDNCAPEGAYDTTVGTTIAAELVEDTIVGSVNIEATGQEFPFVVVLVNDDQP